MLLHHDWQTPACLTMLLKTITHLLDHYRKLVVLDEENKKRHAHQNNNNHGNNDIRKGIIEPMH